ncbi:MAG: flavodoxin-dependent (E)-4-hydroxy-3-methylbut-2-enyl-diphosphate synthase [Planctomycetaceae bacterium]|jgi:(E)-4-hydroxy-3-methylbut-2-enyl-diphosphate synthase|nr:flavodoxin-dependent (E)-4-hydroxy-3-methylbut-2-enyl-diphosphate synthase [Planctomycetaceae bacterium]
MIGSKTREVVIGTVVIGGGHPVQLQSMVATKTVDIVSTVETCQRLTDSGAGIVRVAVDTQHDAEALCEIRKRTTANLSVDLQENYRLAEVVAPYVDKIRYNPGHLHHAEPEISWQKKVERIVEVARRYDCALRIGVNCGSLAPLDGGNKLFSDAVPGDLLANYSNRHANSDSDIGGDIDSESNIDSNVKKALSSALSHANFMESLDFRRFCVSIKSSDPLAVIWANRRFALLRGDIPLHLGLTEAGMPPEGVMKSRVVLETLLSEGIGDTVRVSLTVPNDRKQEEIEVGQLILSHVREGRILTLSDWLPDCFNIISCPSCARVENERFVALAQQVREATRFMRDIPLTVAVMGCRVNGPGETDHADLGLWCGAKSVNLKRGTRLLGTFSYDEIVPRLLRELEQFR